MEIKNIPKTFFTVKKRKKIHVTEENRQHVNNMAVLTWLKSAFMVCGV